ncbi:MAG: ABC transporter substrate-binding protein [Angelakisella sp.]
MKKLLASILAITLSIGLMAGCGAPTATPSAPAPEVSTAPAPVAPAAEPVELSISWWGGDARHEATQKGIDAFSKKYPNITVKTNYAAWTGWEDVMSTALYAGTAQDVNQVNWNWLFNYDEGSKGKTFVDLNTMSDYIDLTQFDKNALAQCTIDGRLTAIPVSMTGRIFYWNDATFKKAGLSVPKTYDELIAAGEVFKTKLGDDYYPMVMGEYDRMIFMVWALECKYGKDWVVDGKLNYTQAEIEEGFQMFLDMEKAHVIPTIKTLAGDGAESLDKNPKWMEGKYAGIFEWDSSATKFQKAQSEGQSMIVGDYLTGFGPNKGGFTKVSLAFAISESAKNKPEAAQLIDFLLNDEEGIKILNSQRGIPLSKKALKICSDEKLLEPLVTEANIKVMEWCGNKLDPTFEDAKLKALNTGVYYDAMAGLSYGDYSKAEAAKVLIDGIGGVLKG